MDEPEAKVALEPGKESIWVIVDSLKVCVIRTDEGVVVDIYGAKEEEVIASTYAYFDEAFEEEP